MNWFIGIPEKLIEIPNVKRMGIPESLIEMSKSALIELLKQDLSTSRYAHSESRQTSQYQLLVLGAERALIEIPIPLCKISVK